MDPNPEGSETFGRIRIPGTEIKFSDPDSNSEPKPSAAKCVKKSLTVRIIWVVSDNYI